ncbi:MAG: FAD-binding oxidoreductase [Caenibius sp.]
MTDFFKAAAQIVGDKGMTTDTDLIAPWLTDWRGVYTGKTLAMASPSSAEQLSALVKLCAQMNVPLVPQGGNSGMVGGATPDTSGTQLLLSMRKMNAIRRIVAEEQIAVCEAGVILQNLHEAAADAGMRFPLTLGGKGSATIGGLISTNAGGTQVLRHGTMRAQVLGLEAVLADGSIFNGLIPLKKDNRGFDLKQLFIGSEGTLGIVTAASLRLLPAIAERAVLWAGVSSIHAARQLLLHFQNHAGELLEGFEVIPAHCMDSLLSYLPDARAPLSGAHPWHCLIELVATNDHKINLNDSSVETLAAAADAGLLADAVIAANDTQAEAFWHLRDSIAAAERALGPAVQHDISVPVERMPDFVEMAADLIEKKFPGTKAVAFGHLGDGNVHFHVLAPARTDGDAWKATQAIEISGFVYDLVTQWSGSISAEHGIGQAKRNELTRLGDPVALDLIRRVKNALDPQGILNPGKLVPLAPPPRNP